MKREHILVHCNNHFPLRNANSNPAACFVPAILSTKVPFIQGVGRVGGGRNADPRIIDRLKRFIMTMRSIISTLSFFYTTLQFIYYTFIHISFGDLFNIFLLITHHLFESWHECPVLLLLLHFLPAHGEADNLSMMMISMTISTQYLTITVIVEMTIQDLMTSSCCDHPAKQLAAGHQKIPSPQHLEIE